MTEAPVLEIRGLTVRFGGVPALDDVNLDLPAGELRCIVGPNGAGKSTLFRCISGHLRPDAGEIRIQGTSTTPWPAHRVAALGVGIKTQVPGLFDSLSVEENIWLAARKSQRPAHEVVADTLARFELGDLRWRKTGHLAHGERQWVNLAVVFALDPRLVLLDEPTAGMTHEEVERTADLVREHRARAAMIIVEHNLGFVRRVAERVTVMHAGRVLMEDTFDVVMQDPTVRKIYWGG